jgi:hypothetical protein
MLHSLDVVAERVVREGHVAVLVSSGFGAGWYSWHSIEALLFDPVVVEMVEQGRLEEIEAYVNSQYPDESPYCGGVDGLGVHWVPVGARFRIDEYDGAESLVLESQEQWIVA